MKRILVIAFALTMALFLGACGDKSEEVDPEAIDGSQIEVDPEDVEMTEEEMVDEDEVVVRINGNEITGDVYNELYAQTKSILAHQGQDTSDQEAIKDIVIEDIINKEILTALASGKEIEVTEEEISSFKDENEERYNAVLEQHDLSAEEFDELLSFDLLRDKYISTAFPIEEVTDEEIKEVYEEIEEQFKEMQKESEEKEEMPELKEVEDQLKAEVVNKKFGEEIEKMKEEADIKINI